MERAAALLLHGLQQTESPLSELGDALARMARTLNDAGTPLFGATAAKPTADAQVLRDALARDMAVCIQSLQLHDRLMQQLKGARDLLTGLAADGRPAQPASQPANEGSIEGSIELF